MTGKSDKRSARCNWRNRDIPVSGDKLGQDELLLKRYLWHAFFTDRYENAAAITPLISMP